MNRDQYLAHFGVKGMRWGFRKKREESNIERRKDGKASRFFVGVGKLAATAGLAYVGAHALLTGAGAAVYNNGLDWARKGYYDAAALVNDSNVIQKYHRIGIDFVKSILSEVKIK